MTVEEKAYNYASKLVKNRLTASEVAAHYGRGYIEGQEDMKHLGWHPASELPKLGEDDDNEFIVIASVDNELYRHGPKIDKPKKAMFIDGQWTEPDVKWWCYPPKEE